MDDIGNILYVLAMIAAVLYSAFKKQKQANKPPVNEVPSSPFDPMEEETTIDDLRDLFTQNTSERKEVGKNIVQPVTPSVEKKEPKTPKPIIKKDEKAIELIDLDEEEKKFEFLTDELDLRKAVIYSEILNRPYQ